MKNWNWTNIWINTRLILIIVAVVFLYSFTENRNKHRKLKKTEVVFEGNFTQFLTAETVNKLLIDYNSSVKTIEKHSVNLSKLEKTINNNNMVEQSQVFLSIDGVLKSVVKQRNPIARVFDVDSSFYVDFQGNTMPLSPIHCARVPLVFGKIKPENKTDLVALLRFINKDDFLKKNIIGIQIFDNGALIMKCRNYQYDIDFGRAMNIENKFNNYKAFFQKTVQDSSIKTYKKITLRFAQQVVCTK